MTGEVDVPRRHLASEEVVIAAPMSFAGSAARIWKLQRRAQEGWQQVAAGVAAVLLIVIAWTVVLAWYAVWSIWLVPYRLVRRGSRKRRRETLMHRETLAAIETAGERRTRS